MAADAWTRFQLRRQMFSIGEDFWIENDRGEAVYKVDDLQAMVHGSRDLRDRHRAGTEFTWAPGVRLPRGGKRGIHHDAKWCMIRVLSSSMEEPPETAAQPETEPEREPAPEPLPGERRTRLSGAWTAIVVGLLALVVILIFILQNQQRVDVSFLIFSGHLPLAVALLFAMILGALIVFAFGAARILQLRMVAGRARRKGAADSPSR